MNNVVHRLNFCPKKRKTPRQFSKFLITEENKFLITETGLKIKLS